MGIINNIKGLLNNGGRGYNSKFWGFGVGSTGVNYIELEQLALTYDSIPEVAIVIDRLASMCSNVKIGVEDRQGNKTFEHPALELLRSPNPLQDQQELLKEHIVFYSLFGNTYQYGNTVMSNPLPKAFWNLNPLYVEPKFTNKLYKQVDLKGIIKEYKVRNFFGGISDKYKTEEVLMKNEASPNHPILGTSKLHSLQKPISNIEGVYETRNIFIYKRGAIGLLTPEQDKEGMGNLPEKHEIKEIQKEYQETYGALNNGDAIAIGAVPMKWTPIVMPVKDLMLFEEVDEDFNRIIDAYNLNRNMFSQTKGSSFNNVKNGIIQGYQDAAFPLVDDWLNSLSEKWGLSANGEKLFSDWTNVPILQGDEVKKAQTEKIKAETYQLMLNNGISETEARQILNYS